MSGKVYGYVRVSTKHQNEERQLIAMRQYGVAEERIVVEKQSGKDFDRPGYRRLLRRLRAGDTLVIQSLDRLGRNYDEIQEQWRIISKEKGVAIIVLDMPLLNTKENAELVGQLITDLVLQLLSFFAQTERESIRARQREGIEAAKARGVRFGRPRLTLPAGFSEVVKAWRKGKLIASEAAQCLGISRSTFFRRVRELERGRRVGGERNNLSLCDSPSSTEKLDFLQKCRHYPTQLCGSLYRPARFSLAEMLPAPDLPPSKGEKSSKL